MELATEQKSTDFVDRRLVPSPIRNTETDRRQFNDDRSSLRPEVSELAEAIDAYKLQHRRRFITFEELFDVVASLGYSK
ncbi:MAG: hypothetical protein ACE5KM_02350 [Planctomycetaceae bacterium]